jgi:hypothetical protein
MKLVLTNKSPISVPLYSDAGRGLAYSLTPGVPFDLNNVDADVLYIGEVPSVLGNIQEGLETFFEILKNVVTKWKVEADKDDLAIEVEIRNDGEHDVRVILGDGVTDRHVAPGTTYLAKSKGYLELRELGHAPQQGGTPD